MSWPQGPAGPPGPQGPAGLLEYRWGSDPAPAVTSVRWFDHRITLNSAANSFGQHLVRQSVSITKLRVGLWAALAASDIVVTLVINGVDSALVATVTAGTTSALATGSVAVVAGDILSCKAVQAVAAVQDVGMRVVAS